jgi:hypothetical protein
VLVSGRWEFCSLLGVLRYGGWKAAVWCVREELLGVGRFGTAYVWLNVRKANVRRCFQIYST